MVLVSFRAGVTVPMAGLMTAAGEFRFKLIFSRASVTWRGFWGAALCCLRPMIKKDLIIQIVKRVVSVRSTYIAKC